MGEWPLIFFIFVIITYFNYFKIVFTVSFDIVVFYTFTFFMNVYICIRILSLIV